MLEKNPSLTQLQCQSDKTSVYRHWLSFVGLLDQILASRRYADKVYNALHQMIDIVFIDKFQGHHIDSSLIF